MAEMLSKSGTGPQGLVSRIVTGWALLGGLVLLAVVLMNTYSVIGNQFSLPFPGDFELTEIGVAIAAFSFLPYCQLTGSNVTADIFTARASARWVAIFTLSGAIVALLFSLLLLWRMYAGMLDKKLYGDITAILAFPYWLAYLPCLISLALLAVAAFTTLRDSAREL